ncbi:MAG: hypothetical protein H6978_15920 [Gammaproteobacteria bacterium]|nr:hypothetical protein [Gammaproteobacteria bacterium]
MIGMFRVPKSTVFLLVTMSLLVAGGRMASAQSPSISQVVSVCESALAADFTGLDAAMCEWYAVPCDCKIDLADSDAPRACIPPGQEVATTASQVVAQLRRMDRPEAAIDSVIPRLLAQMYPCDGAEPSQVGD